MPWTLPWTVLFNLQHFTDNSILIRKILIPNWRRLINRKLFSNVSQICQSSFLMSFLRYTINTKLILPCPVWYPEWWRVWGVTHDEMSRDTSRVTTCMLGRCYVCHVSRVMCHRDTFGFFMLHKTTAQMRLQAACDTRWMFTSEEVSLFIQMVGQSPSGQ